MIIAPVLGKLTGSQIPTLLLQWIVLPLTSGWKVHQYDAAYFGFNNPQVIELLKFYGIESILDKIDLETGKTDLTNWSPEEVNGFTHLYVTLRMAQYEKIILQQMLAQLSYRCGKRRVFPIFMTH